MLFAGYTYSMRIFQKQTISLSLCKSSHVSGKIHNNVWIWHLTEMSEVQEIDEVIIVWYIITHTYILLWQKWIGNYSFFFLLKPPWSTDMFQIYKAIIHRHDSSMSHDCEYTHEFTSLSGLDQDLSTLAFFARISQPANIRQPHWKVVIGSPWT